MEEEEGEEEEEVHDLPESCHLTTFIRLSLARLLSVDLSPD